MAAPDVSIELNRLPEAMESAIYVSDRWPLVVDASGDAARFLKYQRGPYLQVDIPTDTTPAALRRALVAGLYHGTPMVINFGMDFKKGIDGLFADERHFPAVVMNRGMLYTEEVYGPLLRPDEGDPVLIKFVPRDEFKVEPLASTAEKMQVIRIKQKEDSKSDTKDPDEAIAAAYGVKLVKRNSTQLVEAGFDGDLDEINSWLTKGYDLESADAHGHTALSEAACQGHDKVVEFLLGIGADPNKLNSQKRSPMYRAAFNNHVSTVNILLRAGGDPQLRDTAMEGPYDVTQNEAIRKAILGWDPAVTARLMQERAEAIRKQAEERLRTAAERDAAAREALRKELIEFTTAGNAQGLLEALTRAADEARRERATPRVTAEARDERGNTLLAVAAWQGHLPVVKLLLTHYKQFSSPAQDTELKVFTVNVNARDSKGWTPVSIAAFHNHPRIVELLLENGASPVLPNAYHKNAFDLAKDKPEVMALLTAWESARTAAALPPAAAAGDSKADDAEDADEPAKGSKKGVKAKAGGKKAGAKPAAAKTGSKSAAAPAAAAKPATKPAAAPAAKPAAAAAAAKASGTKPAAAAKSSSTTGAASSGAKPAAKGRK